MQRREFLMTAGRAAVGAAIAGTATMPTRAEGVRRDELAHEFLDFETARQALMAFVRASGDAQLREASPALSAPPHRDRPAPSPGPNIAAATGLRIRLAPWEIDLRSKSWSVIFGSPFTGSLIYLGEFNKDEAGRWVARIVSRNQSSPASRARG
jgi:hypothetical protein